MPLARGISPRHLFRLIHSLPIVRYPAAVPARDLGLPGDEPVLGVEWAGEPRAYPISSLLRPHLVNDRVGGRPFLITYCPGCQSGVGFDPVIDGTTHTFAVFGVYQGSLVMQDDQTGTVWAHTSGEALLGSHVGRRLEPVPVEVTTLARWLEDHPDSSTPDPAILPPRRSRRGRKLAPWQRRTLSRPDPRLPPVTRVVGVRFGERARAYALDRDRPGPRLYQDELGDVSIALLAPEGGWPRAFDRRVEGRVVELRLEAGRVRDSEGSVWDGRGRAVSGPAAGSALAPLPSVLTEWYAWCGHHPETDAVDLRGAGGGDLIPPSS